MAFEHPDDGKWGPLEVAKPVIVPDGREGILTNFNREKQIAAVRFIGADGVVRTERFFLYDLGAVCPTCQGSGRIQEL